MKNSKQIYHVEPIYKSFIWGDEKLKKFFNLKTSQEKIGTVYHVIGVPNHLDNVVKETGEHLSDFYKNNAELFGVKKDYFPVRMTTTVNSNFQSYQLHPDDKYAFEHENEPGKVSGAVALTESDNVKEMLFGNKATSRQSFKEMIDRRDWDNLFDKIKVKEGDFVHTPAGVIHGGYGDGKITSTFGTDGDITYRFYDKDRNDPSRPLNIDAVVDCANIPEISNLGATKPRIEQKENIKIYHYYDVAGEYTAKRIKTSDNCTYQYPGFIFFACVGGSGSINNIDINLGETIFVPREFGKLYFKGKLDLIMISYKD